MKVLNRKVKIEGKTIGKFKVHGFKCLFIANAMTFARTQRLGKFSALHLLHLSGVSAT